MAPSPQSDLPIWECPKSALPDGPSNRKIEDYRPGYPRYAALLSAHNTYFLCRRFDWLRSRLLLQKQDKLSILEGKLEKVDYLEAAPLHLGKSRSDRNTERISLLSEIDTALADYDQFMERTSRVLSFGPSCPRDVESLRNWVESTGCLAREETAYLAHHHELVSLAPAGDSAMIQLETWMEEKIIRFWPSFQRNHPHNVSRDSNVYIYPGTRIRDIARAILLLLIILLLLGPMVICNIVDNTSGRIVIVMASTIFFLLIFALLTRSKTIELILIAVTYATVYIGFVAGGSAT